MATARFRILRFRKMKSNEVKDTRQSSVADKPRTVVVHPGMARLVVNRMTTEITATEITNIEMARLPTKIRTLRVGQMEIAEKP